MAGTKRNLICTAYAILSSIQQHPRERERESERERERDFAAIQTKNLNRL